VSVYLFVMAALVMEDQNHSLISYLAIEATDIMNNRGQS
jgi:hypothetical protein